MKKLKQTLVPFTFLIAITLISFPIRSEIRAIMGPLFSWAAVNHDFGSIEQGVPVYHKFTFSNDGDDLLFVTNIKTSCGCTAAEYSREAIAPGEEGFVRVRYNAAKAGTFSKTVNVEGNTGGEIPVLTIKGRVEAKAAIESGSDQ
jgi:Protein of unknown function (DUF1573)